MRHAILFLLFFTTLNIQAQPDPNPMNSELVAHVPLTEDGNDVWGYTDENGLEYAIMGGASNTYIWSLEDIENPVLRTQIPGTSTIWRDMKVWEDHIYVTTDNTTANTNFDGLLIIDMSNAPEEITHTFIKQDFVVDGVTQTLGRCHNIYIDEDGFAYLAGCNVGEGGVLILDLKPDKKMPTFVSIEDNRYSHDVYVQDSLMYTSDIYGDSGNERGFGFLSIYDIRDRANPIAISEGNATSFDFTHNAWTSEDGNYVFTTDEINHAYVDAWDITDKQNPEKIDSYRPLDTEGTGVIPHNTHYFNGYLVTSWYTQGLVVIDAHKPDNLIEVANYDTWQGADGFAAGANGFQGCWGAYPFFQSGYMLASDINSGLYIIDVDFKRACYLEGKITDASTGAAVTNALIEIQESTLNRERSNPAGDYKTGQAEAGVFNVLISHPNYDEQVVEVTLANGEITILDAQLTQSTLAVNVTTEDGQAIENASVFITSTESDIMTELKTDSEGNAATGVRSNTSYTLQTAAWGYLGSEMNGIEINQDSEVVNISLSEGYQDDFFGDLGWTVNSTATAGAWTRGVPNVTSIDGNIINPDRDADGDIGALAFVTGNTPGVGWTEDDIDGGRTNLTSPMMDFTDAMTIEIEFSTWFFIGGDGTPDDALEIYLGNGDDEILIYIESDPSPSWSKQGVLIEANQIDFNSTMQVRVKCSDEGDGNIVEAGIDAFLARADVLDNTIEIDPSWTFATTPNPFLDNITISIDPEEPQTNLVVRDLYGRAIVNKQIQSSTNLDTSNWPSGVYTVQLQNVDKHSSVRRIVKP